MSKPPSFQLSADTRFLVQRLQKATVGETVTYEQLGQEVGKPVVGGMPALQSAKRVLRRDFEMVFAAIHGVGLKRLNDVEIVGTAASTSKKLRRTAQRGVQTLTAVSDFSKLPREEQMRHSASLSIFGAVAEMNREPSIRKIEKVAEAQRGELPFAATLEAFKN